MSKVVSIVSKDDENRMSDVIKTVGRILGWFVFIGFLYITLIALFGAFAADFSECSALNKSSSAEKGIMTALVTQHTISHDERKGFNSSYIPTIITSLCMSLYGLLCVIGTEESRLLGSNALLSSVHMTAFTSILHLMDTEDSSAIFFHSLYAQIALCMAVAYIRLIILEHLERANVAVIEMKNVKP